MTGYVRQSVADILPGEEVRAEPLNAEFNRLQMAFNATNGHTHDGSEGGGPKLNLVNTVSGILPVANGGTGTGTLDGLKAALSLGTAAYTSLTDYATAAQGTRADGALQRSGGTMSGPVNMGTQKITNLAAPTVDTDASTRKFVLDTLASVDTSAFAAHVNNKSNPHEVTKVQVGLGNVDNTSDINKPVSVPTQNALSLKAPLDSPNLTGTPTAPTASSSANNTQIANTAFVQGLVSSIDLYSVSLINRVTRTSNATLTRTNKSNLIDITSGTFTQTFQATSTLGAGWWCYIRNSGTGNITLDPNDSETIDSLTSYVMYPGEARLVLCTGAALFTLLINPGVATFLQSGNFVWPPGVNGAVVESHGAGGGGGRPLPSGSTVGNGGGGGGGGGRDVSTIGAQPPGTVTIVNVGAPGLGATQSGTNGGGGGATTFGDLCGAQGGGGGVGGSTANAGGIGGAAGLLSKSSDTAMGFFGSSNTANIPDMGGGVGGRGTTAAANGGQRSSTGGGGGGDGGGQNASYRLGGTGGGSGLSPVQPTAMDSDGPSGVDANPSPSGGGGGGGSGQGRAGGRGGFPAGGGGGGAGSGSSGTTGNGGDGGAGRMIVRMF